MKSINVTVVALTMSLAGAAGATTVQISGKVKFVEASYMPAYFFFETSSGGDATCPTGAYLEFSSTDPERVKAAYATIMAGYLTQSQTYIVYDTATVHNGAPNTCLVSFIGLGFLN